MNQVCRTEESHPESQLTKERLAGLFTQCTVLTNELAQITTSAVFENQVLMALGGLESGAQHRAAAEGEQLSHTDGSQHAIPLRCPVSFADLDFIQSDNIGMINSRHDFNFLCEILFMLAITQQLLATHGFDRTKHSGIGTMMSFPHTSEGTTADLVFDDVVCERARRGGEGGESTGMHGEQATSTVGETIKRSEHSNRVMSNLSRAFECASPL